MEEFRHLTPAGCFRRQLYAQVLPGRLRLFLLLCLECELQSLSRFGWRSCRDPRKEKSDWVERHRDV